MVTDETLVIQGFAAYLVYCIFSKYLNSNENDGEYVILKKQKTTSKKGSQQERRLPSILFFLEINYTPLCTETR
jgi:hypothetical protein